MIVVYYFTILSHLYSPKVAKYRITQMRTLTVATTAVERWLNPHPDGCLDFPRRAGWGILNTPPSNSAPRRRSEKPKMRSKARQKSFRKYSVNCSLRSILRSLEVVKVKFSENSIFLRKCVIISETISVRRPGTKVFDSS